MAVQTCLHDHVYLSGLIVLEAALLPATFADSSNDDDGVPSLSEMDTYDALSIAFMIIGLAVSSAGGRLSSCPPWSSSWASTSSEQRPFPTSPSSAAL